VESSEEGDSAFMPPASTAAPWSPPSGKDISLCSDTAGTGPCVLQKHLASEKHPNAESWKNGLEVVHAKEGGSAPGAAEDGTG
ncbi:hypothetical protein P7K49_010060, partial [Saguinus oedipus]